VKAFKVQRLLATAVSLLQNGDKGESENPSSFQDETIIVPLGQKKPYVYLSIDTKTECFSSTTWLSPNEKYRFEELIAFEEKLRHEEYKILTVLHCVTG
jgi:hypothetical protein